MEEAIVDDANLYWIVRDLHGLGSSIRSMPLAGGAIATLATTDGWFWSIAVGSDRIFFSDIPVSGTTACCSLRSMAKDGLVRASLSTAMTTA